MNKLVFMSILLISIITAGCSGSRGTMTFRDDKPITTETTTKAGEYHILKNYNPGTERNAFIGQSMLRVSDFKVSTINTIEKGVHFIPSKDHTLVIKYKNKYNTEVSINIELNTKEYPINSSTNINGKKYYIVGLFDTSKTLWGLLINDKHEIDNSYIADEDWDHYFKITSIAPSVQGVTYISVNDKIIKDDTTISRGDLNYELIYSGMNKVAINIAYREFTKDNAARSAFYQNLNYEPGSKQIRFKDTVILINEISNEQIKYTVLSDGLPESPNDHIKNKLIKYNELQN